MIHSLRSVLFYCCILLLPISSFAQEGQTTAPANGNEEAVTEFADQDPAPPANFEEYMKKNLQFPEAVLRGELAGNVLTAFVVEKDGTLSHIEVTKSLSAECDAEAIRFMKTLPPWKPGELEGKPVRTKYFLTLKFAREEPVYETYDTDPVFNGSYDGYLDNNFVYPPKAAREGTHGKVEASFVIEKDGSVTNAQIVKSVSPECDAEVLRLVWGMPAWKKPATRDGKPVRIRKYITIRFGQEEAIADYPDTEPRFPYKLSTYLDNNFIYPEEAKSRRTQGVVTASFVVEADGSITDIQIIKSVSWDCDQEVFRLVRKMPKWIPATIDGQPVRSTTRVSINFSLYATH